MLAARAPQAKTSLISNYLINTESTGFYHRPRYEVLVEELLVERLILSDLWHIVVKAAYVRSSDRTSEGGMLFLCTIAKGKMNICNLLLSRSEYSGRSVLF